MKKYFLAIIFISGVAIFSSWRLYRHFHPVYVPLPPRQEVTLRIIPGWNLRQVADYLVLKGLATSTEVVYAVTRQPGVDYRMIVSSGPETFTSKGFDFSVPYFASFEGYLVPETYRVFADASVESVINKMVAQRNKELPDAVRTSVASSTHTWHQILTMASIIEKETRHAEDRAKVADILWRRYEKKWALQVDSSVHYAIDKTGDVFTTDKERDIDSPWNTYKYRGLPPGPICNPGLASIQAALHPEANSYWYFLSDQDGNIHYARTLDEQNRNSAEYLR